jgi:hypothetical protein
MAGSGLLAGLQGYESVAGGPGKRLGEGIAGMVDQGIGAYTAVSRVRQGEEEGARSQQRLDMAAQLQPGQVRAQDLGNDQRALVLKEAGDQITRENAQREYFQRVVGPKMEHGYTDAKEARLDIFKGVAIGGDRTQMKDALKAYERSLTDDETAKQFDGALLHIWDTEKKAGQAGTMSDRAAILMQGYGEVRTRYPLAAGGSEMKQLTTNMFKLARQMPEPLKQAFTQYIQIGAANISLSPSEVWSRAGEGVDPDFMPEWNAMTPQDVRDDRALKLAGAKEEAKSEAQQQRDLVKIGAQTKGNIEVERVRGEEQRKLETIKGQNREKLRLVDDKDLKVQADVLAKRITANKDIITSLITSSEDKAAAQRQFIADQDALGPLLAEMQVRSMGRGPQGGPPPATGAPSPQPGPGGTPAAGTPAGAERQVVISEAVAATRRALQSVPEHMKTMKREEQIGHILGHNVRKGNMTQREADRAKALLLAP